MPLHASGRTRTLQVSGTAVWAGAGLANNAGGLNGFGMIETILGAGAFSVRTPFPVQHATYASGPRPEGGYLTTSTTYPEAVVEITYPGGGTSFLFRSAAGYTSEPFFTPGDMTGTSNSGGTPGAKVGDVTFTFEGSFTLHEWYDPAHASRERRVYETVAGPWEFTVTASGWIGLEVNYAPGLYMLIQGGVSGSRTISGNATLAASPVFSAYSCGGTLRHYNIAQGHTATNIRCEVGMSGPGVSFGNRSVSAQGQQVSGSLETSGGRVALVLSNNGLHPLPARVNGGQSMDWQWEFDPQAAHYSDNTINLAPHVYLYRPGSTTALASGPAPLRYPPGTAEVPHSYYLLEAGTEGGSDTTTVTSGVGWGNVHDIMNLYCLLDEGWGDAQNILLSSGIKSGNNKFCLFDYGPEFVAARLKIDSTHRFFGLINAAFWTPDQGTVAMDGGAVKFTRTLGGFLDGNPATWSWGSLLNLIRRWRPFAYRYYRFRIKCDRTDVPVEFKVIVSGFQCSYYLQPTAADTWETVEIDLSRPDVHPLGASNVWPVHPGNFGTGGAALQLITPPHVAINFWLEYVEGFHKASEGAQVRVPLRFPRGLMLANPHQPLHNTSDAPQEGNLLGLDQAIADTPVQAPGGSMWGRLITNGRWGLDFISSGSVASAWATLRGLLDSATRDTGIHIELGSGTDYTNWSGEAQHNTGYVPETTGFLTPFPADDYHDVLARAKLLQPFGYPGYGDGSTYGAVMPMRDHKVYRGEVVGSLPNNYEVPVTLELLNQDDQTILATARSDADGFYRLPANSGVVLTYSNQPRPAPLGTGTAAQRQHYTAVGVGQYTYDAIGQGFNFHLLRSPRFVDRDGANILLDAYEGTRRKIVALDSYPAWYDLRVIPGIPGRPVDVLQAANGWLFRIFRYDAEIRVERSVDAGRTWGQARTLATDAATGEDEAAAPTLCRTSRDHLFGWYHDTDGNAQCYASRDYGATWSPHTSVSGLRYPRARVLPDRTWLVGFVGDSLRAFTSAAFGADPELQHAFSGATFARPELGVDRRGQLHLVYRFGTDYVHRWYPDLSPEAEDGWSTPTALGSGATGVYAVGLERSILVRFGSEELATVLTDATHGGVQRVGGVPAGEWSLQYPGACWSSREQVVLVASQGEELITRWSRDMGRTWIAPEES